LLDRFRELNLKYPEAACAYAKPYCTDCVDRYVAKGDFKDEYHEDIDMTDIDIELEKMTKEMFKDDDYVRSLYKDLKVKFFSERLAESMKVVRQYEDILSEDNLSESHVETIKDIIKDIKKEATWYCQNVISDKLNKLADRLESAYNRMLSISNVT